MRHKACVQHKRALKLSDKEFDVALVIAIDAWTHGDLMYKYYIINLLDNILYYMYSFIVSSKKLRESIEQKYKEDVSLKKKS